MIEKPVQFGKNYVKFDQNGKVEYAFVVDGGVVKRLVLRDKTEVRDFVLPEFWATKEISNAQESLCSEKVNDKQEQPCQLGEIFKVLNGQIRIASNCFSGLKNVQLRFSGDAPIKFECGVFDKRADVKFVLPVDMALFIVKKLIGTGMGFSNFSVASALDFEQDQFLLVADKRLENVKTAAFSYVGEECYQIQPFEKSSAKLDFDLSVCHKSDLNAKKEQKILT